MRAFGPFPALLGAILLLSACSQEPDLPAPSPALWEVSGPDGEHGWLFGTAHRLPDGYDWRTERLDAAFAGSDTLAVEVDLAEADAAYSRRLATTPGLGKPSSRVSPAHRAPLAAAFAEAGLSEDDFRATESWAVALALASALAFGDSANGVDAGLADQRGARKLVELEGYRAQLAIFDRLPAREQVDMLEIVAEEAATATAESKQQIDAWRSGDTATIEAAMETGLLADPELREALLAARNRAWAERIDRLLKEGAAPFVAVGAAHLLGEDGVPALLEARGYMVTRIQ
jgi:uncharacterized protein YbaP (TraB family)